MSGSYGRANDPDLSSGPWLRVATGAPLAGSAARIAPDAGDDTYPNKYLRTGWRQHLPRGRAGADRVATMPMSLLFPIVVLLMLSITLRPEDNSRTIDSQVGIRLAGYALAALSVLFALGRRKLHLDFRIVVWAMVPIFISITALYAPQPLFSFAAGIAHLALLFFAWRMVIVHGQTRAVLAIVIAGMTIGGLSILAFYALPDLGRSASDALTADPGGRMRGVTGQPNSLGAISAVTVLLATMHFRTFTARQRVLAIGAIAIAAICIVYSESRTSIAALLLCLLLWRVCRANAAFNLFAVAGIALAACLIITFVPDVSAYLSRSEAGADDLASLNGRSRIWSVAWESIQAHPILGQGYGSSRFLLPIDDRLFAAAVNTHNVYLEMLFSGGVVFLGLFVVAVTLAIVRSATRRRVEALILLLFFLIRGSAESAPFSGLPLFPAFVFYTSISMCLFPLLVRTQARGRRWPSPISGGPAIANTQTGR